MGPQETLPRSPAGESLTPGGRMPDTKSRGPLYVVEEYLAKPLTATLVVSIAGLIVLQIRNHHATPVVVATVLSALTAWLMIYAVKPRTPKAILVWSVLTLLLLFLPYLFSLLHWESGLGAAVGAAVTTLIVSLRLVKNAAVEPVAGVEPVVGLAATGVLIDGSSGADEFVLVLNKNLRNGEGLWVPPGGHFPDTAEDPARELATKVRLEVAAESKLIPTSGLYGIPEQREFSSLHTEWWTVPAFLLNEDLHGKCSQGHERHIDAIYLLRVTGSLVTKHKYGLAQRIHIPVSACEESADSAHFAVMTAVRKWEVRDSGKYSSLSESVSSDVVQRLYLAARWLRQPQLNPGTTPPPPDGLA